MGRVVLSTQGRQDEAIAQAQDSLAILRQAYGEEHPQVASGLIALGVYLGHAQRRDEARAAFGRALAISEKAHGPEHPAVADALRKIGYLALNDDPPAARAAFARAIAIFEKTSDPRHPSMAPLLVGLGEAELLTGDAGAAVRTLERAFAIWGDSQVAPHLVPQARYALAQALWQSGGDRKRARRLAEEARDGYVANQGPWLPMADEVTAWLKAHR